MHMISPVPHWNGSKADDLAGQMAAVANAIEDAATLMRQWQPHGRDYQGKGDYLADREEYMRRQLVLSEMANQYMAEARRCLDLHYGRKPREVTA
jgi:hypothetical protein